MQTSARWPSRSCTSAWLRALWNTGQQQLGRHDGTSQWNSPVDHPPCAARATAPRRRCSRWRCHKKYPTPTARATTQPATYGIHSSAMKSTPPRRVSTSSLQSVAYLAPTASCIAGVAAHAALNSGMWLTMHCTRRLENGVGGPRGGMGRGGMGRPGRPSGLSHSSQCSFAGGPCPIISRFLMSPIFTAFVSASTRKALPGQNVLTSAAQVCIVSNIGSQPSRSSAAFLEAQRASSRTNVTLKVAVHPFTQIVRFSTQ
mmetsp:Transcript_53394/g.88816  ORF Transcript_53394/g.88816 Transcript_53394/m.88816 type:complete len:258 (+) Transcript_53394:2027-2800(+)